MAKEWPIEVVRPIPSVQDGESDQDALCRYRRTRVAEYAAWRAKNLQAIIMSAETAREWFRDDMSGAEKADTRQFLVDNGLAEWMVRR